MGKRVERTRNGGTWTESQFWSAVRSALRQKFRWWKPITLAKNSARRPKQMKGKHKYEYQCNKCKKWFKGNQVEVDHIVPAGQLRGYDDLAPFLERLTAEEGYQVLCIPCHREKTEEEKKQRANESR